MLALLQMLERMRAEAAAAQQAAEERHMQDVENIRLATEECIQVMTLCRAHAQHPSVITCIMVNQIARRVNGDMGFATFSDASCEAMLDPNAYSGLLLCRQ